MIAINFTRTLGNLSFSDCIRLPLAHGWTDEQIEAEKERRFANWLDVVLPPEEPQEPPTTED